MLGVGARTIPEFIERTAAAQADAGLKSCATKDARSGATTDVPPLKSCATTERQADRPHVVAQGFSPVMTRSVLHNTRALLDLALTSERYRAVQNRKAPRKLGTHLWLWDCISCSKCIPACPNDAVFEIEVDPIVGELPVIELTAGGWREIDRRLYRAMKSTQIAIFADACNDCGNCDVFCPEDGGPYIEKPRFFGSLDAWRRSAPLTGFVLERDHEVFTLRGRLAEGEFALSRVPDSAQAVLETPAAMVTVNWHSHEVLAARHRESPVPLAPPNPGASGPGEGGSPQPPVLVVVDLSAYMTLRLLLDALMRPHRVNFVNAAFVE
jgi:putative selenate reductase